MKKLYSKKRSADAMNTPFVVKLVYLASASMLAIYLILAWLAQSNKSNLVFDVVQYS